MRVAGKSLVVVFAIVMTALPCVAVVVYDSAAQNTSAPTGSIVDAWNASGTWFQGYAGTAISPNYFITANHIGGGVTGDFKLNGNGQSYIADATYLIAGTDLRIWHVSTPMPYHVPLYTGSDELNKPLYVFGTGVPRGNTPADEVIENTELKGWKWAFDGTKPMSWGQNTVEDIQTFTGYGDHLGFAFDSITGQNEAAITGGDSSGGLFIQEGGLWKLAAVNHAVDGKFGSDENSALFDAVIFDMSGLYVQDYDIEFDEGEPKIPAFGWSTRISSNLGTIYQTVPDLPEPSSAVVALAGATIIALRRRS